MWSKLSTHKCWDDDGISARIGRWHKRGTATWFRSDWNFSGFAGWHLEWRFHDECYLGINIHQSSMAKYALTSVGLVLGDIVG